MPRARKTAEPIAITSFEVPSDCTFGLSAGYDNAGAVVWSAHLNDRATGRGKAYVTGLPTAEMAISAVMDKLNG